MSESHGETAGSEKRTADRLSAIQCLAEHGEWASFSTAVADAVRIAQKCSYAGQDSEIATLVGAARVAHESGADATICESLIRDAQRLLAGRDDIWSARLAVLREPPLEHVSVTDDLFNMEVWCGFDSGVIDRLRASGLESDYAQTLWNFPWVGRDEVYALWGRADDWLEYGPRFRLLTYVGETLLYRHGAFRDSIRAFDTALALSGEQSAPVDTAKTLVRSALARIALGDLAGARTVAGRAAKAVDLLQGVQIQEHPGDVNRDIYPKHSVDANFACYFDGDWDAIAEHWSTAATLPERGPVAIVEVGMAAHAFARAGQHDAARVWLTSLVSGLAQVDPRVWAVNGAVGRAGRAAWEIGDPRFAASLRDLALRLVDAGVGDWPTTSNEATVATMSVLLDELDMASDYFARARATLDASAHRPQRALIDFDEAVSLRGVAGASERRQALLERTDLTFRDMNMTTWSQRARAEATDVSHQVGSGRYGYPAVPSP